MVRGAPVLHTVIALVATFFLLGTPFAHSATEQITVDLIEDPHFGFLNIRPDSLQVPIHEKLSKDTSFVFWGTLNQVDTLARAYPAEKDIWFHESFQEDQRDAFTAWYNNQQQLKERQLDSVPSDLKENFLEEDKTSSYLAIKASFSIQKIYNRESRQWEDAPQDKKHISGYFTITNAPSIQTTPPKLIKNFFSFENNNRFLSYTPRIFFEDGFSTAITENQLDSLDLQNHIFLPYEHSVEINKNMTQVFKARIGKALARGDKDAIKKSMADLDSFTTPPAWKYYTNPVTGLRCETKRLLSIYLETFEYERDCYGNKINSEPEERALYVMLEDSVKAIWQSGRYKAAIEKLSPGDRAFWQVVIEARHLTDQDTINALIEENINRIENPEQQKEVKKRFYHKTYITRIVVDAGIGYGYYKPIGKTRDLFPSDQAVDFLGDVFGRRIGISTHLHYIESKKITDSTYYHTLFLDIPLGLRTFILPHLENKVFAGPALTLTDLKNKNLKENNTVKEEITCGISVLTAFDFFFTAPNMQHNHNYPNAQIKGRLGLRLLAGYTLFKPHMIDADGGVIHFSLIPIYQGYGINTIK